MAKEKKQNNIVRNMMIALVGGLVVGLGFMLLKQQMSEGTWNVINALLSRISQQIRDFIPSVSSILSDSCS